MVDAAQEELAVTQAGKAALCEELGALQQAAAQFRKESEAHKAEIAAAREAQDALLKKVAELEGEARSMKRHYIRFGGRSSAPNVDVYELLRAFSSAQVARLPHKDRSEVAVEGPAQFSVAVEGW